MTVKDRTDDMEPSETSESEEDILDSDDELQKAFSKGLLKPGTYKEITPKEKIPLDLAGLEHKLKSITRGDLPWSERLDLTVEPAKTGEEKEFDQIDHIHDDFKRELYFYRLAQSAVLEGIPKLHKEGIPTKRPDDYFAQMVKSDVHMKKVREKLLSKNLAAERSEKAKKMRQLKKMGKKVQVEVLKSRQKEKRETLEAVKKYRKGQQDKLDFLNDDSSTKKKRQPNQKREAGSNKKRDWKNKKFGYGGQKKRSKSNNKDSYNDSRDFSAKKNKPTRTNKIKKNVRPGKSKRQQMKSKKK